MWDSEEFGEGKGRFRWGRGEEGEDGVSHRPDSSEKQHTKGVLAGVSGMMVDSVVDVASSRSGVSERDDL